MQYSKLLALERKEMLNQKEISDNWVKYIFLLLEETMQHCERNNILFSNLDEFQQVYLVTLFALLCSLLGFRLCCCEISPTT